MKIGILLNGIVGVILAVPVVRYLLSPVARARKESEESWVPLGNLEQFPSGQTRLATYRNPDREPLGRRYGGHRLLGAQRRWADLPGFCDQLRASRMPRSVVSAVRPVHVSLPRRRVLPGWLSRLRPSRTRLV